ncbi:nitrilase-related carbon-nitrogen hydrolase, partial [Litchfieldia alkalitelluris]
SYPIFDTAVGKIGVLICYDVEFPETSRVLALSGADLIVVPSVWSLEAEQRWDIQLPARALDNSLYVLGVNAVGEGTCGKSKFLDSKGRIMQEASRGSEEVIYGTIDKQQLIKTREDIPYMKDYPADFAPVNIGHSEDKMKGA